VSCFCCSIYLLQYVSLGGAPALQTLRVAAGLLWISGRLEVLRLQLLRPSATAPRELLRAWSLGINRPGRTTMTLPIADVRALAAWLLINNRKTRKHSRHTPKYSENTPKITLNKAIKICVLVTSYAVSCILVYGQSCAEYVREKCSSDLCRDSF
jgi:hypothetical protein